MLALVRNGAPRKAQRERERKKFALNKTVSVCVYRPMGADDKGSTPDAYCEGQAIEKAQNGNG
jgi:hypothetical protein